MSFFTDEERRSGRPDVVAVLRERGALDGYELVDTISRAKLGFARQSLEMFEVEKYLQWLFNQMITGIPLMFDTDTHLLDLHPVPPQAFGQPSVHEMVARFARNVETRWQLGDDTDVGGFNSVRFVDIDNPRSPEEQSEIAYVTEPVGVVPREAGVLAIRALEHLLSEGAPTVEELLREMIFTAYASRTGIGPRQFYAVVGIKGGRRDDLVGSFQQWRNQKIGSLATDVIFVAEAYTGSSDKIPPVVDNYWEALGATIARAAQAGFLHGDMKAANMLFNQDATEVTKVNAMAYTDFDAHFISIFDMRKPENRGMIPCIALVTMLGYLGEHRCQTKTPQEGMNAALERTYRSLAATLGQQPVFVDAAQVAQLCGVLPQSMLGQRMGPPDVVTVAIEKALTVLIGYVTNRPEYNIVGCLPGGPDAPVPPNSTQLQRVVQYAIDGVDMWTQ